MHPADQTHLPGTTSAPRTAVKTPDEALQQLMDGNTRFVNGQATVAKRSVSQLRALEAT